MRSVFNFFFANGVWLFFFLTYWGSLYSWVLNACEVFDYALTKVGLLRERLCFVISKLFSSSVCVHCVLLWGRHTHSVQASWTTSLSWNQSWMLKQVDFCKACRGDIVSSFLDLDFLAFLCFSFLFVTWY